ncbi:extracellular solute-binding protein [Pseudomonas sp. L-22-4S-12]|uniref:extracellular solute-binding protein n=1 Tax=Pseudomonas sp. L-22-4S-12 TaxID=2610893 RepID=UPI002113C389|nr:extracellular solute-binding protein [Pseudomonas sp. L-22-4S-12]
MTNPLRTLAAGLLLFAGLAQAAPQHALTLYGEPAKYPADFQHFAYVNPDAPKGGTLRLPGLGGFDSLNPFIPKGNVADRIGLLYDSLTYRSLDEPFTEYGLLAEKIEKAPDNSFVRFYLNPKARFRDGVPVTAADVVFTFNALVKHGHPQYRHYYADVAQVVAEDPRRVRFDFKHSGNRELPLILGQLEILPRHWWNELDASQADSAQRLDQLASLSAQVDGKLLIKALDATQALPLDSIRRNYEQLAAGNPELPPAEQLKTLDDSSLQLSFPRQPAQAVLDSLAQLKLLPAKRDFAETSLEAPLGSGPYHISKIAPGSSIRFERNPDWWAKDLPVARGLYNFARIDMDYYRDTSVALEAFKAGQFDVNLEYSAKDWTTGYDSPALRAGKFVQQAIPNHNPVGMQGYVFNTRRPIFQDRRVREAIALLFDFEWASKQLFHNAYKRTHSYFENSEMAARGLPDSEELKLLEPLRGKVPPEVFTSEFKPPVSDASGIIREQSRRAYQLLTEAGYRIEDDKMIDAQGKQLAFEFLNYQANLERVILPFKRNLAELGIDLQIRRVDTSQFINRLRSRDFDMTSAIWPQSSSPGNEQLDFWHSSSADNPGSSNLIGLRDPAIDQLVEGLIRADSRQALINHARALDRVLLWGHYVVPNYYVDTWRVAYWKRFGRPAVTPLYDYGLMTWWEERPVGAAEPSATAPAEEVR